MSSSLDLGQGPFLQDDHVSFHGISCRDMGVRTWPCSNIGLMFVETFCVEGSLSHKSSWELFSGMWLRTLIACPSDSAKIMVRASLEGCLGFDFGSRN